MTVAQLRKLLESLPCRFETAEVFLRANGECDAIRWLMASPPDDTDPDDDGPTVVLSCSLDSATTRYQPAAQPSPLRPCECDDCRAELDGGEVKP